MVNLISKNHFSAEPNGKHALELRCAINEALKNRLLKGLHLASSVIPNATDLKEQTENLDISKRFSSTLYTAHHMLSTGIQNQDPGFAMTGIGHLRKALTSASTYQDNLSIQAIDWDFVDTEIVRFLFSAEGPRTEHGGYPEMLPPSVENIDITNKSLISALKVLENIDPEMKSEFDVLVGEFRYFTGRAARGMTSVRCFGRMYLRCPDPGEEASDPTLYFLDHITHETSHLFLHALMNTDPLILNKDNERFAAPIRPDLRPLYGIYHATYVLSRIVRVLAHGSKEHPEWLKARDASFEKFNKGLKVINDNADMTELGKHVIRSCENVVRHSMG